MYLSQLMMHLIWCSQNGEMYCFEQKKELNLLDMTEIQYPISCLAWSPSYSRMAIGSNEVSFSSLCVCLLMLQEVNFSLRVLSMW